MSNSTAYVEKEQETENTSWATPHFEHKKLKPLEELDLIIPIDQWATYPSKFVLADKEKLENLLSDIFHNNFLTAQQYHAAQQGAYQIHENYIRSGSELIKTQPNTYKLYFVESCYRDFNSLHDCSEIFPHLNQELHEGLTQPPTHYLLTDKEKKFFSLHNVLPCKFQTSNFLISALINEDEKKIFLTEILELSPHFSAQRLINSICKINETTFPNIPASYLFVNIDISTASKILCCSEIKIEHMIESKKIKAYNVGLSPHPLESLFRIPLYELLIFLKNDSSQEVNISYEELKNIITEEFSQKYDPINSEKDFFMGEEATFALRLKIEEQQNQLTELMEKISLVSERPSVQKFHYTIKKAVTLLIKIIENSQDNPHQKWTINSFLEKLEKDEKSSDSKNLNESLAKRIFQLLPPRFRAKQGERPLSLP